MLEGNQALFMKNLSFLKHTKNVTALLKNRAAKGNGDGEQ